MSARQACQIQGKKTPLHTLTLWVIFILAMGDLSITYAGVQAGVGHETNSLYAFFIAHGLIGMIIGSAIYLTAILLFFEYASTWLLAIGTGVLVAIHTYGILSWVRILYFPQVNALFAVSPIVFGSALIAAFMTIYTYVDFRTCPGPITRVSTIKP